MFFCEIMYFDIIFYFRNQKEHILAYIVIFIWWVGDQLVYR